MSRLQNVILSAGVVIALALAGMAVYIFTGEATTTPGDCLQRDQRSYYDPMSPTGQSRPFLRYAPAAIDKPAPDGTAPLWWFGAGAVAVLSG